MVLHWDTKSEQDRKQGLMVDSNKKKKENAKPKHCYLVTFLYWLEIILDSDHIKKNWLDSTLSLKMYCLLHLQRNVLATKGKRLFKDYATNNIIYKTVIWRWKIQMQYGKVKFTLQQKAYAAWGFQYHRVM